MILKGSYKTYVVEEKGDNTISIKKNNDEHQYDVLEVIDDLSNDSFCVLNHLFVNEGMEDAFEKKFLERPKYLQNVPGFKALRFLRPQVAGRHYIILTLWKNVRHFMIGRILMNIVKPINIEALNVVLIATLLIVIYLIMCVLSYLV